MDRDRRYIQEEHISDMFVRLLVKLLHQQPSDPLRALIGYFEEEKKQKQREQGDSHHGDNEQAATDEHQLTDLKKEIAAEEELQRDDYGGDQQYHVGTTADNAGNSKGKTRKNSHKNSKTHQRQNPRKSNPEYLQEHHLTELFQTLTTFLLNHHPVDPIAGLVKVLKLRIQEKEEDEKEKNNAVVTNPEVTNSATADQKIPCIGGEEEALAPSPNIAEVHQQQEAKEAPINQQHHTAGNGDGDGVDHSEAIEHSEAMEHTSARLEVPPGLSTYLSLIVAAATTSGTPPPRPVQPPQEGEGGGRWNINILGLMSELVLQKQLQQQEQEEETYKQQV